jgi:hypothetical protein
MMTIAEMTDFVLDWIRVLEVNVQEILDVALPNKQQHKTASKLVHQHFDHALVCIAKELDKRDE